MSNYEIEEGSTLMLDYKKLQKIAHAHLNVPMLLTLFMIPSIGSHCCKVEKNFNI